MDIWQKLNQMNCVNVFEDRVKERPGNTAVVSGDQCLTYGELNQRANQVAQYLISHGVGPGDYVPLLLGRSVEILIVMFGILKSGAAYVPLDPAYPEDRLQFIIQQVSPQLIIANSSSREKLRAVECDKLYIDLESELLLKQSKYNPEVNLTGSTLAYVLFTSGSTGKPKGVMVPHLALINLLIDITNRIALSEEDRWVSITTISFDISGLELYGPLMKGATVYIASREEMLSGDRLRKLLESSGATIMQATPTTWRMLFDAGWSKTKNNFRALVGGEAFPVNLLEDFINRVGSVWNMYGPTETTIWSACKELTKKDELITIGVPIANTTLYVLDEALNLTPPESIGELYISGFGVAQGYLNRLDLTNERFIENPFLSVDERRQHEIKGENTRLYRTGDLGYSLLNGETVCLGRTDQQVKIRGFRIELGEIENQLLLEPSVRQAALTVREDVPGFKQLVAYLELKISAEDNLELDAEYFKGHLRGLLPEYMIPSHVIILEIMPLTPNGKIDRTSLPAPKDILAVKRNKDQLPKTDVEKRMVRVVSDLLKLLPESISREARILELGIDSLSSILLLKMLKDEFQCDISLGNITTVSKTSLYISRNLESGVEFSHSSEQEVITCFIENGRAVDESLTRPVEYKLLELEDIKDASEFLADIFIGAIGPGEPMTWISNITKDEMTRFIEPYCKLGATQRLSVIAHEVDSNEIIGVFVCYDHNSATPDLDSSLEEKFSPICRLLDEVDNSVSRNGLDLSDSYLHQFSIGVKPGVPASVSHFLARFVQELARLNSYKGCIAEATGPITQAQYKMLGYKFHEPVKYDDFIFRGKNVFYGLGEKYMAKNNNLNIEGFDSCYAASRSLSPPLR